MGKISQNLVDLHAALHDIPINPGGFKESLPQQDLRIGPYILYKIKIRVQGPNHRLNRHERLSKQEQFRRGLYLMTSSYGYKPLHELSKGEFLLRNTIISLQEITNVPFEGSHITIL